MKSTELNRQASDITVTKLILSTLPIGIKNSILDCKLITSMEQIAANKHS